MTNSSNYQPFKDYDSQVFKTLVGEVKATYMKNDQYRFNKTNVKSSSDAYKVSLQFFPDINYRESFFILMLNRANNTLGYSKIAEGGVSGVLVDTKILFQHALLANASGIILIHNHPSGALKPSSADIEITTKIKKAAKLLDIAVLDHLIITEESHYSFSDNNLI